MPFDKTKLPKVAPKESGLDQILRVLEDPLTTTLGLKPTMDKMASPSAAEAPGVHGTKETLPNGKTVLKNVTADEPSLLTKAKGFGVGALEGLLKPTTLAQIATLPLMAGEVPAEAAASGVLKRALIPKVLGTTRMAPISALAKLAPEGGMVIPATLTGTNAVLGTQAGAQTLKDAKDPTVSKTKVALDALNTALMGLGTIAGGVATSRGMAHAAEEATTTAKNSKQALQDALTAWRDARAGQPPLDPHDVQEMINGNDQWKALQHEFKRNPGGDIAKEVFPPQGGKKVGVPEPLSIEEENLRQQKKADAIQKTRGAAEDANVKFDKKRDDATKRATDALGRDQGTAMDKNLAMDKKAADDLAKAQGQAIEQNKKIDAKTLSQRGAAEDTNLKVDKQRKVASAKDVLATQKQRDLLVKAADAATKEDAARTDALTQQSNLDNAKAGLVEQEPSITETSKGKGENGENQTLTKKWVPKDTEGNDIEIPSEEIELHDLANARKQADRINKSAGRQVVDLQDNGLKGVNRRVRFVPHDESLSAPTDANSPFDSESTPTWVDPLDAVNFKDALKDAKHNGFTGSDAELRSLYQKKLASARDLMEEMNNADSDPHEVLRQIAKYGGVTEKDGGLTGELNNLWESSSGYIQGKGIRKGGGVKLGHKLASGGFRDIPGVLRQKGGRTLDDMARLLQQDQRFAHIQGPDDVINAISEAASTDPKKALELPEALDVAGVRAGEPWWQSHVPDVEVSDYTGGAPTHTIDATIPSGNEARAAEALDTLKTDPQLAQMGGRGPLTAEPNLPGVDGPAGGAPRPLASDVPNNLTLTSEQVPSQVTQPSLLDAEAATQPPATAPPAASAAGAIPAKFYPNPLEGAGERYGFAKAAKALAKKGESLPGGVDVPLEDVETARRDAGMAAQKLNQAQPRVAPEAPAVSDIDAANAADLAALEKASPEERASLIQRMKSQTGATDTMMMSRIAGAGIGATAGSKVDEDHPLMGAALGGAAGAVVPDLALGGLRTMSEFAPEIPNVGGRILRGVNKFKNSAILGPYAVAKKASADLQALGLGAIQKPDRAGDILGELFTPAGLGRSANRFTEGMAQPYLENQTGLDNFVTSAKNPLSWSGKIMGGLTNVTKGALGEGGYTVPEQEALTMTENLTKDAPAFIKHPVTKHLFPFMNMAMNRAKRGFEYSPLTLLNKENWGQHQLPEALIKSSLGSLSGVAAQQAAPEDFVKDHPLATSLLAAGPTGLPTLMGLAAGSAKQKHDDSEPGQQFFDNLGAGGEEVARELPGVLMLANLIKGDPRAIGRNYFSSYTNGLKPIADLTNPEEAQTTGKDLSLSESLFNRMLSNIPGVRGTLPETGRESRSPFSGLFSPQGINP